MSAEGPTAAAPPETPDPREQESELDRKLVQYGQIALPIATVLVAIIADVVQGPAAAVLVLTGGVLIGVIALLWASVRTLIGETPLSGADAYALGAPRVAEEQKRALLRALKDLEFEHSVGKISDEDYRELTAKYRAEAKLLLRQIDAEAQPRRAEIEALVNKRLRKEGLLDPEENDETEAKLTPSVDEKPEARSDAKSDKGKKRKKGKARSHPAADEAEAPEPAETTRVCTTCSTVNDEDAVFCKKCGARQGDAKAADAKTTDAKTADAKTADAKTAGAKTADARPAAEIAKAEDGGNDDEEEAS